MRKFSLRLGLGLVTLVALLGSALAFVQSGAGWDVASAEMAQGKFEQAVNKYSFALGLPVWTTSYRVKLLIDRGKARGQLDQIDAAISDFNEALSLQANNIDAIAFRAYANLTRNKFAEAINDYNLALTIMPDNLNLLFWRARSLESDLQFDKAIADFDRVTKRAPHFFDAIQHESYNLARLGKTKEAVDVVSRLSIDKVYAPEAYIARANLYDMAGGFEQAIADYETAIRLNPNLAITYQQRGMAYLGHDMQKEAIADFNKAIELEPANASFYYNRGLSHVLSARYSLAMQDLSKSVEGNPRESYAAIWLQLMRLRHGLQPDVKTVSSQIDKADAAWPAPIIRYFDDQIDAATLRATAAEEPLPLRRIDLTCEAEYYIGARTLAEGHAAKAWPVIQHALDICPPAFVEVYAARRDLELIGK